MAWFWSDDIARALVEAGTVVESQIQDWLTQPHAIAAPEGSDLAELGLQILGSEADHQRGAA